MPEMFNSVSCVIGSSSDGLSIKAEIVQMEAVSNLLNMISWNVRKMSLKTYHLQIHLCFLK